ncbi:hypothetical protein [Burkholderia multivorans]|uniref:hypothetical protein n=1 Tax=Burkholderia multivorans TaxID=87883 RepID=UPI0021BEAA90|nr:hypothetical protein [Burkholderia multivorans]MDN7511939.1 hypothetical protein [Burkholderia multivorans]
MAKYAHFDSNAASPQPVIGWFDTDTFYYPNLPPQSNLIEMTDDQWIKHFNNLNGWAVSNGALIEYS